MTSLFQTRLWAQFKARHGWRPHELSLPGQARPTIALERPLPLGLSLIYAPEVRLPDLTTDHLANLAHQARRTAPRAIFFRLELLEVLDEVSNAHLAALTQAGYRKAFEAVQPEQRQWLDISGAQATILAQMKEKGRYNIRLAGRKGVTTRISTDTKDVEVFYRLFQETARRDGFKIRDRTYFEDLCQTLFSAKRGELVIAEVGDRPLAAFIMSYYDGLASYLYGASSNQDRNLMAPYAAHWAAIGSAKKHGCTRYDLLQIAPAGSGEGNHYAQLTRFKQQFGGQAVALLGSWDYRYRPTLYQLFRLAEQLRRR